MRMLSDLNLTHQPILRIAVPLLVALVGILYPHWTGAQTTSCSTPPFSPCFDESLTVPGGDFINLSQPTPFLNSLSGSDGAGGFGTAFGQASVGAIGAKAVVVNAGPPLLNGAVDTLAIVQFSDYFRFPGPIVQPTFLQLTFDLHGMATASGGMRNGGFVQANFDLRNEYTLDVDTRSLFAAGTVTLSVPIHQFDLVDVGLGLFVEANAGDTGGATSDFLDTLGVTRVALADSNGAILRDVTLTDFAGNSLSGQVSVVPEPSTLSLLTGGLAGIFAFFPNGRRRRPPTPP
jgi:hypothetical protein